jgi:hypothetical protein
MISWINPLIIHIPRVLLSVIQREQFEELPHDTAGVYIFTHFADSGDVWAAGPVMSTAINGV